MTQATETLDERTTTTTEATVEEVEVKEVRCPHCSQWYEPEHIVPVRLGPEDSSHSEHAGVCDHCAENVYGYEPAHDITDVVIPNTDHWTWREYLSAFVAPTVFVGVVGFVIHTLIKAASALSVAATKVPESTATTSVESVALQTLSIAPVIMLLVLFMSLATTLFGGVTR